ncbi:DUF4129 domain-containing protein [Streptomyces carpaticus]|uniref:DUF4129 domain-containing protein n=1 Tax=Streptomyces carpaticus TaxID=285558 RepID=UPI0031F75029
MNSTGTAMAMAHTLATAGDTATEPPLTIGREAAREAAERELSKQIYAEHEPGLVRRVFTWVIDRVFGALESVAFHAPGGWLGLLIIALLAIGLLLALRLRLGALRTARGAATGALFTDRPRTAAEHRAAAEHFAQAGQWDQAVQEQLRALVRSLEERALLDTRPGRTAGEAADEAARVMPALAPRLRAAATTFGAVTYGGRHATPADHHELRDLDTTVLRTKPDLTGAAR